MRNFWVLILAVGLLITTACVYAQEAPNLQSSSWAWTEKGMSVKYFFGQANEATAKIILTENNFGYQMTRENCYFYVPFIYQIKGNLLYASLPGRKDVQVSKISFASEKNEQKLQAQKVEYFVKTSSAISGEHKEIIARSPQFLERVNN